MKRSELKTYDHKKTSIKIDSVSDEIIGLWWDANEKNAPIASFEINKNTILYPDHEEHAEYKYKIKKDSFFIFYEDYISSSKILKIRKDSLELNTNGQISLFVKNIKKSD
ncbi:MAG: hypothetical protein IPP61_09280 [Cytophagaceae bacterium]|nr:hypothetical protein [Cytophagaceae bacterium]